MILNECLQYLTEKLSAVAIDGFLIYIKYNIENIDLLDSLVHIHLILLLQTFTQNMYKWYVDYKSALWSLF